jgi:Na+/proline symporter
MVALLWKVVDWLRMVRGWPGTRSGVVTQLLAWAGATVVVFLYGASDFGTFEVPGTQLLLSDLGGWSKVILGLAIGSTASVAVDVKQAVDNTDTASKPPLLR